MSKTRTTAVIGAGAWGTALAMVANRTGQHTFLVARNEEAAQAIRSNRQNTRYLPGMVLDAAIEVSADAAIAGKADHVLLATPAQTVAETCNRLRPHLAHTPVLVTCAKGIDRETGRLPAEQVASLLPDCPVAVLSGPSFAIDVARDLPTAVAIACSDGKLAALLAQRFSASRFRCYASTDVQGVELGGALKNVIALAVGAARGMTLGASAEAALVARGFAEMCRLAVAVGADPRTLTGLSGLGDLVLTCSSAQSRNFAYGMALGAGEDLSGRPLAEGIYTANMAAKLAAGHQIRTPIIDAVADVLAARLSPEAAVAQLLERPLTTEHDQEERT